MALTYEIHPLQGLVTITRTHHPTFDEWRAFMERLLIDPKFRSGSAIVDDRRCVSAAPSRNEVEIIAAWIRTNAPRFGDIRWAVVVDPAAQAAFGMARVSESLTDRSGVTVRPFTSLDVARAWACGAAQM